METSSSISPDVSVRKLFEADREIVGHLGITLISISSDSVVLGMVVADSMINSQGFCHGGFLFTLADTAAAYTVATRGVAPVTTEASISYIAGALSGEELRATGRIEVNTERTAHVTVRIQGKDTRDVALYTATALKRRGI